MIPEWNVNVLHNNVKDRRWEEKGGGGTRHRLKGNKGSLQFLIRSHTGSQEKSWNNNITIKTGEEDRERSWEVEKRQVRDFPGGAVVKTPCFHCRGHGLGPWLGK